MVGLLLLAVMDPGSARAGFPEVVQIHSQDICAAFSAAGVSLTQVVDHSRCPSGVPNILAANAVHYLLGDGTSYEWDATTMGGAPQLNPYVLSAGAVAAGSFLTNPSNSIQVTGTVRIDAESALPADASGGQARTEQSIEGWWSYDGVTLGGYYPTPDPCVAPGAQLLWQGTQDSWGANDSNALGSHAIEGTFTCSSGQLTAGYWGLFVGITAQAIGAGRPVNAHNAGQITSVSVSSL
jgi:hypothetical protein